MKNTFLFLLIAIAASAAELPSPDEKLQIETKMADLNANDLEGAMRQVEGTARSMGIEVVG